VRQECVRRFAGTFKEVMHAGFVVHLDSRRLTFLATRQCFHDLTIQPAGGNLRTPVSLLLR